MRVLFAAHQFFPEHRAGTETLTLGLARALSERGHETAVFAAKRSVPAGDIRPGAVQDYEFDGVPVRRVGRPQESLARSYRLNYDNPLMALRLGEHLREFAPDVVHFTHLQGLSANVIPAVKETGVPAVYTATDFWTICPVVDLLRHDGALCTGPDDAHCPRCVASRQPGSKVAEAVRRTPGPALSAAASLSRTSLSERLPALERLRSLSERPAYIRELVNSLDRILAPTHLMRDLLVRNGVREDLVEISRYGLDASHLDVSRKKDGSRTRFGFIGTLGPHKGLDLLLRAFRRLPPGLDASLTIYGEPGGFEEFHERLRRMAEGDDRVSFAGPFPPERLGAVLSEMDVLVVPSRWYENAPLVVYSAFAAGIPVVATGVGGLSEVVEDGRNGLLFPLEDAEALSRCLGRMAGEPGLLVRLRQGIEPVKSLGESAEEMESLYNGLVSTSDGERSGR